MKKFIMIFFSLIMIFMVACEKTIEPVEMSLVEKIYILQSLDTTNYQEKGFYYSVKADFSLHSNQIQPSNETVNFTFKADMEAFLKIGNEAKEAIAMLRVNELDIKMRSKFSLQSDITSDIKINDSFLLIKNNSLFASVNANIDYTMINSLGESTTGRRIFVQEQMNDKVLKDEDYNAFKNSLEQVNELNMEDLPENIFEQIDFIDKYINVYKTGDNSHRIEIKLDKSKAISLIKESIDLVKNQNILPSAYKEQIDNLNIDMFDSYLQNLDLSLSIDINDNKLVSINFNFKGKLDAQIDEMFTTLDIRDFSVVLDYNHDDIVIPDDETINAFTKVDQILQNIF